MKSIRILAADKTRIINLVKQRIETMMLATEFGKEYTKILDDTLPEYAAKAAALIATKEELATLVKFDYAYKTNSLMYREVSPKEFRFTRRGFNTIKFNRNNAVLVPKCEASALSDVVSSVLTDESQQYILYTHEHFMCEQKKLIDYYTALVAKRTTTKSLLEDERLKALITEQDLENMFGFGTIEPPKPKFVTEFEQDCLTQLAQSA